VSTVFTFPGRAGDACLQFPVAYQWSKVTGQKFTCWLDERSCKMVKPLFEAQPCVESVEFKPGIESYNCGGQPFHFDLPTSAFEGHTVHHLGFRSFPNRQITLETAENFNAGIEIDREALASEPTLRVHDPIQNLPKVIWNGLGDNQLNETEITLRTLWPEWRDQWLKATV
jgi:hypothetical protein